MKLAKTKLFLALLVGVYTASLGSLTLVFNSGQASAATKPFINAKDVSDSGASLGRFSFTNPFTIVDSTTQGTYHVASQACSGDQMYFCHSDDYGDTFAAQDDDSGHGYNYWYWPTSGGTVPAPTNGVCPSALVLGIPIGGNRNAGEKLEDGHLSIVNATVGVANTCVVYDSRGKVVPAADLQGHGIAARDDNWIWSYDNGCDGTTDKDGLAAGCDVKSSEVAVPDLTSGGGHPAEKQAFLGLGTLFHWTSKTGLQSYIDSVSVNVLTDQPSLASIKTGLQKGNSAVQAYADTNTYAYYSNSACISNNAYKAILVVNKTDPTQGNILHRDGGNTNNKFLGGWNDGNDGSGGDSEPSVQAGCLFSKKGDPARSIPSLIWQDPDHQNYNALIGLADAAVQQGATPPAAPGSTTTSGGDGSSAIDCTWAVNPLTWIVCPVVDGINTAASKMDEFVNDQLQFDNSDFKTGSTSNGTVFFDNTTGTGNSNPYYTAWSSFRVIATALIVIAGLVMVASQAFGFELLDAYTIRKVLPRLLVAVIGISLSWPLMEFAVGFFNVLGKDIGSIMFAPFGDAGGFSLFSTATAGAAAGVGGTLLLAGVGLGILGALSFGLTAILALLVGFIIILVRNVALIAIMIVAPVAIAAYILPNTSKVWKLWWDNFLGLLVVYPIITVMIAAGKIFSYAALGNAQAASFPQATAYEIMGFVAYIIPYFALPFAFRLATGAIGTIAGIANDRGRGAFDRLKKYRGNKLAYNGQRLKSGERFNNGALNALSARATTRNFGVGKKGNSAYNQKMDLAAAERAKSASGQAVQHNDGVLRAQTYSGSTAAWQNMAKDFKMYEDASGKATGDRSRATAKSITAADAAVSRSIAGAQANGGFGRNRQVYAAQQLAATGTGYDNQQQVSETIARVAQGNRDQASSLAGNINSTTKQVGRWDLASGFGTQEKLAHAAMGIDGKAKPTELDYHKATLNAAKGVDAVSLLRGKPAEVKNLATALAAQHSASGGLDGAVNGQIGDLLGSLQYASPENQRIVRDAVGSLGVPPTPQGGQQMPGMPGAPPPASPPPGP